MSMTSLEEALTWAKAMHGSSEHLAAPPAAMQPSSASVMTPPAPGTSANQPQRPQATSGSAAPDPMAKEKLRSFLAGLAGPEPDILNAINKDPAQREEREKEYCDWLLRIAAWRAAGGGRVAGKPGAGQAAGTPPPAEPFWIPHSDSSDWRANFEKDLTLLGHSFRLVPLANYPKEIMWEVLFGGLGEGGGTVGARSEQSPASSTPTVVPQNSDRVKPENLTRPFTPLGEIPKALERRMASVLAKTFR